MGLGSHFIILLPLFLLPPHHREYIFVTGWGSKGLLYGRSLIGGKTEMQSSQKINCTNTDSFWIPGHYLDSSYGTKLFCNLFWSGSFNCLCCVQSLIKICWKSVGKCEIKSHSGWYALMKKHVFEFQIKLVGLQKTHISNSHIRGCLPGNQLTFHLLYPRHWRIWMLTSIVISLLTPFPSCTSSSQTWLLFSQHQPFY